MSATNATTYYELPVFIATDKPAWLTDWNGAMNAIDTAIKEALTAGENAQTTANTATTSIATINDSLTTINTSLSTLTSTTTGLVGSVNTINSLIGNGEPTTSDKTLIGAINEIYGMITGGGGGNEIQAGNVVYDNTTSGLTADDVQEAIDEVVGMIPSGSGPDFDLTAHTGSFTITSATGTVLTQASQAEYNANDDYSIIRLAGGFVVASTTTQQDTWFTVASLSAISGRTAPDTAYEILLDAIWWSSGSSQNVGQAKAVFNTDGTIDIKVLTGASAVTNGSFVIGLNDLLIFE